MLKISQLLTRAKLLNKTIVFPEGTSDRVLNAVSIILKKKIAKVILIGTPRDIMSHNYNVHGAIIMEPHASPLHAELANVLYEKRKAKGMTQDKAKELVMTPFYFATMLVECGYADGMVGGVETSTADCLRPALQVIKAREGITTISSCVMFVGTDKLGYGQNNVLFTADCALNISPSPEQIKDITLATVDTARKIANIEPKVALLSFSTNGSGGDDDKVIATQEALKIISFTNPNFEYDGEMQLDCALTPNVAKIKFPQSKVAGKANILIFPDLQSGNIGYKLIERFSSLQAVGQICQGFRKPINDMSRGCRVEDIVVMTAITILQSQN